MGDPFHQWMTTGYPDELRRIDKCLRRTLDPTPPDREAFKGACD